MNEILKKLKCICSSDNDTALAIDLGVDKSRIVRFRSEEQLPSGLVLLRMIELLSEKYGFQEIIEWFFEIYERKKCVSRKNI